MKAILISVDYADILDLTLPYNRHHFDDVLVVTTPTDVDTRLVALRNGCRVHMTEAFYENGATFNKWKALEEGFNHLGRSGWICNMDADVLWPDTACDESDTRLFVPGVLYTPLRRMCPDIKVPHEASWDTYPLHRQQVEWAGYTQIFHADDPHLGPPPWFQTNWRHAGGADSFFQAKWPRSHKLRPGFEVLHLGESGVNWCGRASRKVDGSKPEGAESRMAQLRAFIRGRMRHRRYGDPYAGEKLT